MKAKTLLMINASLSMKMLAIISKGKQITIPAKIRRNLGLKEGSKVEIRQSGKKIVIEPLGGELEKLFEESKKIKPKYNLTAEQMDELNERMMNEIHR